MCNLCQLRTPPWRFGWVPGVRRSRVTGSTSRRLPRPVVCWEAASPRSVTANWPPICGHGAAASPCWWGELPVVLFTVGGMATPVDAAMMMQLGAERAFLGIFKSGKPADRADAIWCNDWPDVVANVSRGLG